ncbi:MAG: Mu-like prophage major head subunit gpT family protein [Fimbriimonadia bacterium]|nr:Mu-like prophage major head subunit gpT family protein [Fimbriimonadia bacterium]
MPLVRTDMLPLLEAGLRVDFFRAYQQYAEESVVNQIATVIRTTLPVQKYGWMGAVPTMREFVDERTPIALRADQYAIADKVWESSISVERRALEDDQYDLIRLRVQDLAREASRHRERLIVQTLIEGLTTGLCYDGKPLFDTQHQEGNSGQQSNRVSAALSTNALQEAISEMMQIKDDRGEPMGVQPDTLLVGPKLKWLAMELVESPVVVQVSASNRYTPYKNVLQGRLNLAVSPYLTGSDAQKWFLLDTSRSVRSVILQERRDVPLEFAALDKPNGEHIFMRDVALYGARARYGVGYGFWQMAYAGVA